MNVEDSIIWTKKIENEEKLREESKAKYEEQRKKCRQLLRDQKQFLVESLQDMLAREAREKEQKSQSAGQQPTPESKQCDKFSSGPMISGGEPREDMFRTTASALTLTGFSRSSPTLTRAGHDLTVAAEARRLKRGAQQGAPKELQEKFNFARIASAPAMLQPRPFVETRSETPPSAFPKHPANWAHCLRWEKASSWPKRSPGSLRGKNGWAL